MDDRCAVLYVSGDPAFTELSAEPGDSAVETIEVHIARSAAEALDRLDEGIDCVVTEFDLPDDDGLDLIEGCRERVPSLPFVLFCSAEECSADAALAAGVTEYCTREGDTEDYRLLTRRICSAVERRRLTETVTELQGYRTLVETVGDPMYMLDENGRMKMVNQALLDQYGYDRGHFLGSHVTEVMPSQEVERGTELILELLEDEERSSGTYEALGATGDGREAVSEINLTVLTDEEGQFVGSAGVTREITERKERAEELDQYRTLVETIGDPMYRLDEEGTFVMVNEAMERFTGYSQSDLEGEHVSTVFSEDAVEAGESLIEDLLEQRDQDWGQLEFRMETNDGSERIVEDSTAVLRNGDGGFIGTVGVLRDITDRKRREQELAEYETIIETVPVGLSAIDDDGVMSWANESFYSPLGYTEEELVGKEFAELILEGYFEPDLVEEYLGYIRELLSSKTDTESVSYELVATHESGEEHIYDMHTALLPLDDGEFTGTVNAFLDVTKQREYKRELERQNEQLEQFASLVSHDLRNPLNVAKGHLQVAISQTGREDLREVKVSLDRMEELIGDLLSLARQGRSLGEVEPVELGAIAEDAWDAVDTADGTVEIEFDGQVEGDDTRLQQLFENLFRNAIQHGGDDVTVRVGALENGFFVADDGPGIPDDRTEEIFDLGVTTEESGTGFGLGIVQQVAEAHGWEITVRNGEDDGARFEITDSTGTVSTATR
jgi:PAS domain S-box-containing protein